MKNFHALAISFLFAAGAFAGCAQDTTTTAAEGRLTQDPGGSCAEACGAQSADGCWCDAECVQYGDCCRDKALTCDGCSDGEIAVTKSFDESTDGKECVIETEHCVSNDQDGCPLFSPLPPDYCADGEIVQGPTSYIPSSNGMECEIPSVHCVTTEFGACPLFSPLPPDYCADGEIVQGDSRFIPSTIDGMECEIPSVHCITTDANSCTQGASCEDGQPMTEDTFVDAGNGKSCVEKVAHCLTEDFGACPQFSPLPPDFCSNGRIVSGPSTYIQSADGMECEIPSVHCVTNNYDACPLFQPLPPDYCQDGEVMQGPTSFIPSSDGMECEIPSVHCVDVSICSAEE